MITSISTLTQARTLFIFQRNIFEKFGDVTRDNKNIFTNEDLHHFQVKFDKLLNEKRKLLSIKNCD